MELALERTSRFVLSDPTSVSILVFVELALEHWSGRQSCRQIGVSILVFVELALELGPSQRLPLRRHVSILVFVELALEPTEVGLHRLPPRSFNPCFCGTGARTWHKTTTNVKPAGFNPCFCGTGARTVTRTLEGGRIRVSILVFVELALELWMIPDSIFIFDGFQSLFLWNWRSNSISRFYFILFISVSILVFVELALERYYYVYLAC